MSRAYFALLNWYVLQAAVEVLHLPFESLVQRFNVLI
jgi:hypothetical protein